MLKRAEMCLLVMALVLLAMSCTKIPDQTTQWKDQWEGGLGIEKLADETAIPSKLGKLISVSHNPDFAHMFQLWFQDEDGNVSIVVYNMNTNRLLPDVILIPQK